MTPSTTSPAAGPAPARTPAVPSAADPATATDTARAGSAPAPVRPYQDYVYAYPHKTAYRPLPDRPALREVWRAEPKGALALYAHIPFCEVRCGFCNLFTRVGAPGDLTTRYLDALDRQAAAVREALGDDEPVRFAAAAFGGGTPTYLSPAELDRLCDIAEHRMGADLAGVPLSVEASPATATADRLAVLAARGATRISLGVQSFAEDEARAAVRPQKRADVEAALARIRDTGVPVLNIDLIYGIDGQSPASWRASLDAALAWRPEELYLYPLYARPKTPLHTRTAVDDPAWDAQRLALYRQGRDHLREHGYEQVSMRMFRRLATDPAAAGSGAGPRTGPATAPAAAQGPADHACQSDGMVGLGCGARSYTAGLHYSFDYAVGATQVRAIIDDYTATGDFTTAPIGRRIDPAEARRRHLLQSLLQAAGMDTAGYRDRFGTDPRADFAADLAGFAARGWLDESAGPGLLRLSPRGLAYSDAVGPALFSAAVRAAMSGYELR